MLTASEAGLLSAPDTTYLERSFADGWVVVTNDADFLRLSQEGHPHPPRYHLCVVAKRWMVTRSS